MLKYFVITLLLLSSCVTKKVNIAKTQTESYIDSSFAQKKDSLVVRNNAVIVVEKLDEIEVVPIDTTKPIIIDNVKYFNATLRLRKYSKSSIDTSKTISSATSQISGRLIKNFKAKEYVKSVEKNTSYWSFVLITIIVLVALLLRNRILKLLF